jgi:hypothetical protein
MTNGTVLTNAANQICQPTSMGPGVYVDVLIADWTSLAAAAAVAPACKSAKTGSAETAAATCSCDNCAK